jgi:hypothetical protein
MLGAAGYWGDNAGMLRVSVPRAILTSLLFASTAAAGDKWTELKTGMTRSEAMAVLGAELVASSGRGFEVAIYDGQAEVVYLRGQVVAWTAPASSKAEASPKNAWQFEQVARARTNGAATRRVEPRRGNGAILPAYRL